MTSHFCIIGGGIVGLATAWNLLGAQPEARLVLLEKEDSLGRHQTGHNSGVIHAGIDYAPGSLKARVCREGLAGGAGGDHRVLPRARHRLAAVRQADRRHQWAGGPTPGHTLTRMIDGSVTVGPNAVLGLAREDYPNREGGGVRREAGSVLGSCR